MSRLLIAVLCLLLVSCGRLAGDDPPSQAAEPDRVVGVSYACTYITRDGNDDRLRPAPAVTHPGTGPFCMPATPHVVGTTRVLAVRDLRAVVTVRTAQGGSYTVETPNTEVKVGDVWPP